MLESGPSELMIQEAPLPREGVSTSPERVEAAERDVRRSRELRESRTDQEHRDKEDGIRGLDEAFAIQNVREAQGAGKPPESSADRIKIAEYGNLANLAYVDFASGPDGSPKATWAALDPLSFPNVRDLDRAGAALTDDEKVLKAFLDKNPTENFRPRLADFGRSGAAGDVSEILYVATGGKFDGAGIAAKLATRRWVQPEMPVMYAELRPEYRATLTDVERPTYVPEKAAGADSEMSESEKLRTLRLQAGLEHVRKYKAEEGSELFEEMKAKGHSVVDRFPDKENGESWSSGFAAIATKDKDGRVTVSVRWTELTDFWDLWADFKLILKRVPENQTRDLVKFMDRVLSGLPPGEKVRLSGHSLWGALVQIGSVIYGDRIEESYTFNSPGAKGLAADPGSQPEYARGRFEKYAEFGYDKGDSSSVENRMVNVAGSKGPSLIANLNEDVGFYEIKLDKVQSHSITTMVKEISKETTELTVVDVRKREETNSEETNTQ